jgi:uncharacterized phosphosugar-binding protein
VSLAAPMPVQSSTPYLDALSAALERARLANRVSLSAAARIVEDVVAGDGIVYAFGSGHSQLAVLELNGRAGSISALQVLFDPCWGAAEHVEGYGKTLFAEAALGPGDCLIAVSHSGATAAAVDVAMVARAAGAPVIAVTSPRASRPARTGRSAGPRLFELADVVLDDGAAEEDPGISVAGLDVNVGPTSTVVAAALLQEIVVEAVAGLASRGLEAWVLRPNSESGGREHNERLRNRYRGRVRRVP